MFEPDFSVPVILNSSPDTTLMATPKMNPVSTAADRNSAIQPILSTAMTTNSSPATSTIAVAIATASSEPAAPIDTTAAPNTGAVDEPGPCTSCFDVVKSANTIMPNAAAYNPFWTGTPLSDA